MKEEELLKKLQNTKLPEIEMPSHQRRLKMALLATGCPRRHRGLNPHAFKTVIKGGTEIIMKGLLSKQPVWKTGLIGIVGLMLVITLGFALPPLFTESVYAETEDIVKNSPEIRAILGSSDNASLEIVDLFLLKKDGMVSVVVKDSDDAVAAVNVDTGAGKVMKVTPMNLNEAIMDEVFAIAEADPEIKKLLDNGAVISGMSYAYSIPDEPQADDKERLQPSLMVIIEEADEIRWTAEIDMDSREVINLRKLSEEISTEPLAPHTRATFSFIIDTENGGAGITVTTIEGTVPHEIEASSYPEGRPTTEDPIARIAKADPAVKELMDNGGNIITVMGITAGDIRDPEAGEITEQPLPAIVIIELDGRYWYAEIDIKAEKVIGPPVEIDTVTLYEEFGIYVQSDE